MSAPSVTVIIPTYNAASTLGLALRSLGAQEYAGRVDVLVVDGGSADQTRAIAGAHGARVLDNPARTQEAGCGLGVRTARGDLVMMLDADNELPHAGWLSELVAALKLAPDVAGADALYHSAPRGAPAINRLAALIGGTDPVSIDLGWSDRWGHHNQRWTRMPVQEEDFGSAVVVRIDPGAAPPMGSNGFLLRRDALLRVDYDPFFHPEVVADIAALGFRFARVRDSIIHHFAPDTRTALRKARHRAGKTARRHGTRRAAPRQSPLRVLCVAVWSVSLVGPTAHALLGFTRRRDPAWALYPLLHLAWTLSYAEAYTRRALERLAR
jgi:glycosyltransferase involved in cell wall biosynthesis